MTQVSMWMEWRYWDDKMKYQERRRAKNGSYRNKKFKQHAGMVDGLSDRQESDSTGVIHDLKVTHIVLSFYSKGHS